MTFDQWLKDVKQLDPGNLSTHDRAALMPEYVTWSQARPAAPPEPEAPAVTATAGATVTQPAEPTAAQSSLTLVEDVGLEARISNGVQAALEQERASERQRVTAIRQAAVQTQQLANLAVEPAVVQEALDSGATVERARGMFVANIAVQRLRNGRSPSVGAGQEPVMEVGAARIGNLQAALCAAILQGSDHGIDVAHFGSGVLTEAAHFRGAGVHDVARIIVGGERPGVRVPVDRVELWNMAISTNSFPAVLENVQNRQLLAAYERTPTSLERWTQVRGVDDFKDTKGIRLSGFGRIPRVNDGGELKNLEMVDNAESYRADSFGGVIVLTFRQFINGLSLNAWQNIAYEAGESAKRTQNYNGYALLTQSPSGGSAKCGPYISEGGGTIQLFDANHPTKTPDSKGGLKAGAVYSNNLTGATTALAKAALQAAVTAFMKTPTLEGAMLQTEPRYIIVPVALFLAAQELLTTLQFVPGVVINAGASSTTPTPTVNVLQGALEIVREPELDLISTTGWYLAAARGHLVRVHLNGYPTPIVERKDPANRLAVGWQVVHHADVGIEDWRGLQRNAGA